MITKKDWEAARDAWKNVLKQSEIDMAQANLYLEQVEKMISSFKD